VIQEILRFALDDMPRKQQKEKHHNIGYTIIMNAGGLVYVSATNKKNIILCSVMLALSMMSLVLGRTLSNTLLLTQYSLSMLPWFYLAQSVLLILISLVTGVYQSKYPKQFSIIYKVVVVLALALFVLSLHYTFSGSAFIIATLLWTFTGIGPIIALDFTSDCFDVQEFKQFNWILQVAGTLGAVLIGLIVANIPQHYDKTGILGLMILVEFLSIFCIFPMTMQQQSIQKGSKNSPGLLSAVSQNTLFKYLALTVIASAFVNAIIDYNFKFALTTDIDEKSITNAVNIIYVISIVCTLVVQVFFLDRLLQKMGSKKMILIFPLLMLACALLAVSYPDFTIIAALFICNQVANNSTFALSKSLCTNIFPQGIRSLARIYLDGGIEPIGTMLAALAVFGLSLAHNTRIDLTLIILASLYTLYLCRHAIKTYTTQLTESVYLRRFNPELINITDRDDKEIEDIVSQSLQDQNPDTRFFALQLLSYYKLNRLPASIATLLVNSNPDIQKETARLLAVHRDQREFENSAREVFISSENDSVRWYLCLYLLSSRPDFLIQYVARTKHRETLAYTCIRALIYLKLGDIQQHITALQQTLDLYKADEYAGKKWFLRLLQEVPDIHDDEYLVKIINEGALPLKMLAIQQIGSAPSPALLACLIEHIGTPGLRYTLNDCLIRLGDTVTHQVVNRLHQSDSYSVKTGCLLILSNIKSEESERCLLDTLRKTPDMLVKTITAKYLAYQGVKQPVSKQVSAFLTQAIKDEISLYQRLCAWRPVNNIKDTGNEINARLFLLKKRVMYYFTAISGSVDILNSTPLLTNPLTSKDQKAVALELIDSNMEDRMIASWLLILFTDQQISTINETPVFPEDPLLETCLRNIESHNMESFYLLIKLRKLDLFKNLSAETLLSLAKCCVSIDMIKDEIIFKEGEAGDGLYLIDSGNVDVSKQGHVIAHLTEGDYFGEMALLVDTPRYATITATSEGALIFIGKQDFDRITDEVPEIMKSIVKQVIHYLTDAKQA